jgi:hypothetical protein
MMIISTYPLAKDLLDKTILTEQKEYIKHAVTTLEFLTRVKEDVDEELVLDLPLKGDVKFVVMEDVAVGVDSCRDTSLVGAISISSL